MPFPGLHHPQMAVAPDRDCVQRQYKTALQRRLRANPASKLKASITCMVAQVKMCVIDGVNFGTDPLAPRGVILRSISGRSSDSCPLRRETRSTIQSHPRSEGSWRRGSQPTGNQPLVSTAPSASKLQRQRGMATSRIKPSAELLLLAGCLKIASATTIVAIRTPAEVVIAADSAATIQGDGRPRTTGTVRKIYEVDASLFFCGFRPCERSVVRIQYSGDCHVRQ